MALQEIPGGLWYPPPLVSALSALSLATTTLNAATEKFATIFRVPRTGTLDTCEFRIGTVTNNPDNGLRISFQTVDAAGLPDGVQDQFRTIAGPFASASWVTPGLITSDGTDTGTKRSVTAGELIAVVIEFESFVALDSINIDRLVLSGSDGIGEAEYFSLEDITGAWVKITATTDAGLQALALKYATDGYVNIYEQVYPAETYLSTSYNSGSTPDERAMRFQVPITCVCDGAWVRIDADGDVDIVLYDNADVVLATATIDASQRAQTLGMDFVVRWAGVTLTANTTYRLSVRPSTVTSVTLYRFETEDNARMQAAPAGSQFYESSRTDAGAWTDTDNQRPFAGLHISQLDNGAAGDTIVVATQSPAIVINQGVVGY